MVVLVGKYHVLQTSRESDRFTECLRLPNRSRLTRFRLHHACTSSHSRGHSAVSEPSGCPGEKVVFAPSAPGEYERDIKLRWVGSGNYIRNDQTGHTFAPGTDLPIDYSLRAYCEILHDTSVEGRRKMQIDIMGKKVSLSPGPCILSPAPSILKFRIPNPRRETLKPQSYTRNAKPRPSATPGPERRGRRTPQYPYA